MSSAMPPPPPPLAEEDAGLSDIGRVAPARRGDDGTTDSGPGGIPAKKNDGSIIHEDGVIIDDDDGGNILPDWKERINVSIARSRKIRRSNYVQILTIDVGVMEPQCRMVVFRGFLKGVVPSAAISDALLGGKTSGYVGDDAPDGGGYYGDCVMQMITDSGFAIGQGAGGVIFGG